MFKRIVVSMVVSAGLVLATVTPAQAVDYKRSTVTGQITGETAQVTVTLNGVVKWNVSSTYLPHNFIVFGAGANSPGTLTVHAERNSGLTGSFSCEIVDNGVQVSTDSDTGTTAVVDCSYSW